MTEQDNKKGKLVVISGPSGVGKSTIAKEAKKQLDNAYVSISATTREKSESEVEGREYYFMSKQQFKENIEKGLFLEYAEVFGNLYGTPKDKVDSALQAGKTVLLEIDVQGGKQVKSIYPDALMIFILPPTKKDLARRMEKRARDDEQAASERLDSSGTEIAAAWQYYEHMVINDVLEHAIQEVVQIIKTVTSS